MNVLRVLKKIPPPIIPAVIGLLLLELLTRTRVMNPFLIPPPTEVAMALIEQRSALIHATLNTVHGAVAGFAISAVVGIGLAVALSSSRWIQAAFYPYAVFFQTVPIVAIAPLLVIWFGNDIDAVIASACIVSVFPIIANTLSGLLSTDQALKELFILYRASKWATLFKLRLPFALPAILVGLRVGAGLAVIGAIVGEFVSTGSGLGGLITVARQRQQVEIVFAALILSACVGIAMFAAINVMSRVALRHWHASEKS